MKIQLKAALLFGLALSFAAPALAAPPDLGKDWKLIGQKKVRYFVADRDVDQSTSRTPESTTAVGTEIEKKDQVTRRERRDGRSYDTVDEVAENGKKTADRRTEGRHLNTYANQEVNTYKLKITRQPYSLVDVSTWNERTKTRLASTYVDKTTVTWTDPFTRKNLASTYQTKVGPLTEYSYSAWRARSSESSAGNGEDLVASTRTLIASRIDVSKVGSVLAPAFVPGEQPLSLRTEVAFSEGGVRGSAGSRQSSMARAFSLSGSQKIKSNGNGKFSNLDLSALVDAARGGQSLYLNGRMAFKLGLQGHAVVFVPVDGRGVPQTTGVALAPGSTEAEGEGVEIRIRGISSGNDGGLVLAGKFRQAYLSKEGKGETLTTL